MKIAPLLMLTLLCLALFGCFAPLALALTPQEIADIALESTVLITMKNTRNESYFGSGFIIGDGQVATNYHVIEDQLKGSARLVGKSKSYSIVGVVGIDKRNDLAILKVEIEGITPLPLGDSDAVRIGQAIYVAGNPRGHEGTFSNGIISGFDRNGQTKRIQMTAPTSKGSSGGPVLNDKGEVIGVVTGLDDTGQNINFAVPSKQLKLLLNRSKNQKPKPLSGVKDIVITGLVKFTDPGDPFESEELKKAKRALESEFHHNMGVLEHNSKRYYHAIGYYDKAIKMNPTEPRFYRSRASAKFNLGMYAEAIKDYDAAIRYKPDDTKVYYYRGAAKYQLKQMKKAKQDFQKAAALAKKAKDEDFYKIIMNRLERMNKGY